MNAPDPHIRAPSSNGPAFESPYEQLAARFTDYGQIPLLIIGEHHAPVRSILDARINEMTAWDSLDGSDHPGGFGGILAPYLLEGSSEERAYADLSGANRLLRDGGILATAVRYGAIAGERPALGSNTWNVSGLIEVVTNAGFSVEDLRVSPYSDAHDPYLVMSVLARKRTSDVPTGF